MQDYKNLPILKHERHRVLRKFSLDNHKYRIDKNDDGFYFLVTKYRSRYFHCIKILKSLSDAENFLLPQNAAN